MRQRSAFTLIEVLTVISILGLLAALTIPIIMSGSAKAERVQVRDEIVRLTAIWDLIKLEKGVYPTPEVDNNLSWDVNNKTPGILNGVVEKYNFQISIDRLDEDMHYIDLWGMPIKYVKGDYANRIDKSAWDEATNLPQDTNKPIGDPSTDIAAESDWNPDNKGGFAYIWSYGDNQTDESKWIYKRAHE